MRVTSLRVIAAGAVLIVISATVALGAPVSLDASPSVRAVRGVQAVLVSEYAGGLSQRVSIVSLAGKQLPVAPRLRTFRWGASSLSPDARFVAEVRPGTVHRRGIVLVGRVRGGSMQTVLEEPCPSACPYDPTLAWSPDSRHLALAAGGGLGKPSVLRLVDVNGRLVKSFAVPSNDPDNGRKVAHRVISWSPDGSRLLLMRYGELGPSAAVVLEIATGRLHAVARFAGCDGPDLEWSPDGRLLALTSDATQDCLDRFELIDALRAKTLISREWDKGLGQGGTLWAPDSKSVFGTATTYRSGKYSHRIDRIYVTGRRVNVIEPAANEAIPRVALATGLIYDTTNALYLRRFAAGKADRLTTLRSNLITVEPLRRLP